jgi:broad specificity phosphatase PhoE
MKTKIFFVRHAEAQTNVDPFYKGEVNGLTEVGIAQAQSLANSFKNVNIIDIFTSDSVRTKLTAFEIEKTIDKKSIVLDFVKERKAIYLGDGKGEYKEDFEDFKQRIKKTKIFLENLPEGNFIFVGHAIFLKALIAHLFIGDKYDMELSDKISEVLIIDNASVSKCMFDKDKLCWKIESLNRKVVL